MLISCAASISCGEYPYSRARAGQEVRDDRDAVAAQPGAGVVREERERLRRGRLDDLPWRDAELVAHERELVRERDVDGAEGVLVQLRRLGDHRARDRDHVVDDLPVEELRAAPALVGDPGDELRRRLDRPVLVARVHALGRVAEEDVLADHGTGGLQDRLDDLVRRPWVSRRLQDDELAGAEVRRHGLGCRHDVGDVRRAGLGERSRDADRQRVEVAHARVVGGRAEAVVEARVPLGGHVDEVRRALLDRADPLLVQVDAGDVEARLGERHRQREAGIAEPDRAQPRLARLDAIVERRRGENLCHGFGW